ncbi:MAG: histone deacetylase family protein [Proteobacteria bacterium]|nr:histone deacetylase family protein [Pseudomonadota bacterium]NOG59150.1 histone deacetylase family protein [Pseudomonadota bacterium]
MTIAFITHHDCLYHEIDEEHPEASARLDAINDQIIASGIDIALEYVEPPLATNEQLTRVHDKNYIESIFRQAPETGRVDLDSDTSMNPHSLNAALRSAGAVIEAVDSIQSGKMSRAFCCVRPPGHHAEKSNAMGFCIFNNVAVGAAHALESYGMQRVAIVDFDVHHGNGTEDIFQEESRILFCSSFQHPFYPFTDLENHAENIIKIPLDAGSKGAEFRQNMEQFCLPQLEKFKPELIFISAGFDAHREDDMSHVSLVEEDYIWITSKLAEVANKYAQGKIISVLEGGYSLSALGRSVVAHIKAML